MSKKSTLILYPGEDGQYRIREVTSKEPAWIQWSRAIIVTGFLAGVVGGSWWLWMQVYW